MAVNFLVKNRTGTVVATANTADLAPKTAQRIQREHGWTGLRVVREVRFVRETVIAELAA